MIDNYDLYRMYEAEQERKEKRLPVCCLCDNHIYQDSAVYMYGEWYCDDCLRENRKEIETDD